jgi:hypothetical protein
VLALGYLFGLELWMAVGRFQAGPRGFWVQWVQEWFSPHGFQVWVLDPKLIEFSFGFWFAPTEARNRSFWNKTHVFFR